MKEIEAIVEKWMSERLDKIEVGELYSRNPIVHRWKAPFRTLVIRELVFWRHIDLLNQVVFMIKNDHILGARILLRSAFETIGILIYLNQRMNSLSEGLISYDEFESMTKRLLLGTKRSESKFEAINILTILEKCDKTYPGIFEVYKDLSETSHPNFEGMSIGYSELDEDNFVTHLKSRWKELFSGDLENLIMICISTFDREYNHVWPAQFSAVELWFEKNDDELRKRKT